MRSRRELYVASFLLIVALVFARVAMTTRLARPVDPGPRTDPTPAPRVVVDPRPDKRWTVAPAADGVPVIQIAILLDTSSSMDGLIDQARTQLWRIVNEFGRADRSGRKPQVQVALYEYGKADLPAQNGYLRQIAPFTTDLDGLSEELFSLRTNGGEEYCGQVIRDAVRDLAWRPTRPGDLRFVFIAGNEPFSQGSVDYHGVCRDAAEKGIVVNTVFCGDQREGASTGWADGAALGGGRFLAIDQNQQLQYVAAPQDDEIARLNEQLNQTYLPYGAQGEANHQRQKAQDAAVGGASREAYIQRAAVKAEADVYENSSWDLCDAVKGGRQVSALDERELPADVRAVPAAERQAYVEKRLRERTEIQAKIKSLTAAREKYVASRATAAGDRSLGSAVLQVVHEQAGRQGYTFEP